VQYARKGNHEAKVAESMQPCSASHLEDALNVLGGRWKMLILFHLFSAPVLRFSELRRAITGISHKMLIQQLRELEKDGVVGRTVYPEVPPRVEYALTKSGVALLPALQALQYWAASRITMPAQPENAGS
jgi:DNA-binding HxlR family transcriptional regulator